MVFAGFFRSNSPHSDPPREHSEDEDEAEEDDDYRYDKLWVSYLLPPLFLSPLVFLRLESAAFLSPHVRQRRRNHADAILSLEAPRRGPLT
jgi:hypothetical protein